MRYSHLFVRNPGWDEKMSRVVMRDFWEHGGEWKKDHLVGWGEMASRSFRKGPIRYMI